VYVEGARKSERSDCGAHDGFGKKNSLDLRAPQR